MTAAAPHLARCHRYDTSGVVRLPGKGSRAGGAHWHYFLMDHGFDVGGYGQHMSCGKIHDGGDWSRLWA